MSVTSETDDVDRPDAHGGVERAALWQVPDVTVGGAGGVAEDLQGGLRQRHLSEDGLDQGRLARSVRPENRDEFAGADVEARVGPHLAPVAANGTTAHRDDGRRRHRAAPVERASASSNASSCCACQSWKATSSGGLSVNATTGMPASVASPTRVATSGVAFCWLYAKTRTCRSRS